MEIKMLRAFDIPQDIINQWERAYGENLLPIQERAVKEYKLLQGTNLVVFAPTSSGKTFIGEIAAVASFYKRRKVFFLLPMKALAEEKFMEFREKYLSAGINTVISTRDRQEFDGDIISGNYHIAIIVFEKLNALLVSKPSLLEDVGLIIVDELQMLGDEERGAQLEILLTKVLRTENKPQILGLSAVLGEAKDLSAWLGAQLLMEDKRPVELRKGVFFNGTFYYMEHNSKQEGTETWQKCEGARKEILILQLAKYLSCEKNESTIVFLPDKTTVDWAAMKLRELVTLDPVDDAIEELSHLEESHLRDVLMFLLKKGIALHHADLSWDQREVIERFAREGKIKLLISTTTLGLGMNMPFKNAILDHRRWRTFKHPKDIRLTDKTKSQLENEAGRVARFGFIPDFGRAILVTEYAAEKDVWLKTYVKGAFETLSATLDPEDMKEYILNFIASDCAHTKDGIKKMLQATYTGSTKWNGELSQHEKTLEDVLAYCEKASIILPDEDGRLVVSDIGKLCAQKNIKLRTARFFLEWMGNAHQDSISELELLLASALTEDGQGIFAPFKKVEYDQKRHYYRSLLQKEIHERHEENKWLYKQLRTQRFLDYNETRALKETLMLSEWVTNKTTSEIEQKFFAHAGAIQKTAQEFSWLLETLSRICELKGWKKDTLLRIQQLSRQLIYGVTREGLALTRIRIPGLTRGYISILVREGYDTLDALKQVTDFTEYKRLLPKTLATRLYAFVHEMAPSHIEQTTELVSVAKAAEPEASYITSPEETAAPENEGEVHPESSEADTTRFRLVMNTKQCRAYYKGVAVTLPNRVFDFLLCLCEKPLQLLPRNALCKKLFPGEEIFPSDERIKMNHLKYTCTRKLKTLSKKHRHIKKDEFLDFIITRHSRGYMLNLQKEEILIVR